MLVARIKAYLRRKKITMVWLAEASLFFLGLTLVQEWGLRLFLCG